MPKPSIHFAGIEISVRVAVYMAISFYLSLIIRNVEVVLSLKTVYIVEHFIKKK